MPKSTEARPLVIVESPAKAKTIGKILGADFVVESSIGHIRDLPRNASEVPAAFKGQSWARMGVDVDNGFRPIYVVSTEKKAQVTKLKSALKAASALYLATDEDREGESIAWHLTEVLNPKVPVKRMVFHEITRPAIEAAVRAPRDLDQRLVDAQEARRILDRLYGYEVSPVLWKKVMPGLSAGRVQSVATRILVERERARMRFRAASYWDLEALLAVEAGTFAATLVALDGARLASGRDFDESGSLTGDGVVLLDEAGAGGLAASLTGASFHIASVEEKPWRRSPAAPFMTSTLQQEAGRKLRFGAQRTMRIAQSLYENGYITYMRTDSVTLSETAVAAARSQAEQMYGKGSIPDQPRTYTSRVKNAQEAHEAIRPAGDTFRTPDQVRGELNEDQFRLYELVWKRTIASQMVDAKGRSVQVRAAATSGDGREATFAASGKTITDPGFLRAYVEGADDPDAALEDQETVLPAMSEGDPATAEQIEAKAHATQPPARYTEASLVKALEEMGVGRPSTYASIIATIEDRGYIFKKGSALVPSFLAFSVIALLEQHFERLVDYEFTAQMEDDLDQIAEGQNEAEPWLRAFYFGNGSAGLHKMVTEQVGEIDAREVNSIPLGSDQEGNEVVVRVGRYGPYVQRGEDRASIPEDLPPDELTVEMALELISRPDQDRELGVDPDSGLTVYAKAGRFGPYVQLGEADGGEKPKTGSLLKTMTIEDVTLEQALKILSLPRAVGVHPDDGETIEALNGRYGPYIRKGKESRTLPSEEALFEVTLEEALALLAEPPRRRGRAAAAAPLKELGDDPASGKPVVVKDGRFGPYVTDGETNASLRSGDTVEDITIARAAELLQARRDRGPAPKRRAKPKGGAKKPAAKKAATKKTAGKKAGKSAPQD